MFGVVPKPLWSKRIMPDERNRIPLALRSLLVEHPEGLVLIETGLGNKEDAKFLDIYGVENRGAQGPTQLEDALYDVGVRPEEIKWVINTHLHFDHAGGNTLLTEQADVVRRGPEGRPSGAPVRLAFPNATYVVQRGELEFARHPNERTRASYLPANFDPVSAAGRWRLLDGDGELLPGIAVRLTPGHVPYHQSVLVRSGGETLIYLGDITPTSHHLPLPYIMGYDLEPLRTLETKRALLQEGTRDGWWLFFGHDVAVIKGRLVTEGREPRLVEVLRTAD